MAYTPDPIIVTAPADLVRDAAVKVNDNLDAIAGELTGVETVVGGLQGELTGVETVVGGLQTDVGAHTAATTPHTGHLQVGGQIGGTAAEPDVRGLRETGGPTELTMGEVADGAVLQRSGTDIVGGAGIPTGTIFDFAGASIPAGWLDCNGQAVSRTTYAALFTAIADTWGVGDGSTTFNVPDLRRRSTVGAGGTGTATLGNAVGNTGGEEAHTLAITEMPSHNHGGATGNALALKWETSNVATAAGTTVNASGIHSHTIASQGGGASHNNMPPAAVVTKIIKT